MSKLPGDIKKRKAAVEEAARMLDCDLREKKLSERVIPYSDKLFRRAAIISRSNPLIKETLLDFDFICK